MADATCSIEGCARRGYCRGWCKAHYVRFQRHGDPLGGTPETIEGRLLARMDRSGGPDSCWPFVAPGASRSGHLQLSWKDRMLPVHRLAYQTWCGPIPDGLVVRHRCDNPPCCNPAHLELGTVADNNRDRDERGRQRSPKGEQAPNAKLTESDVIEIRRLADDGIVSQKHIGEMFGISQSTVHLIHVRKAWRHVA